LLDRPLRFGYTRGTNPWGKDLIVVDLLTIAGDLTGAMDVGAQFAGRGLRTVVAWGGAPVGEADVWSLDTESRDLAPDEARRRVGEMAGPLVAQVTQLYVAVDPDMSGNASAGLEALLAASGAPRILLAPACPARGWTTAGGRQPRDGAPPSGATVSICDLLTSRTGLACDSVQLDVVRRGAECLASYLQSCKARILVVDATEDADLATIARAATATGLDRLLAGSAGLAAQLPAAWGPIAGMPPLEPIAGPVLIVAGARHPGLSSQLARLQAEAPVQVVGGVLGGLLKRGQGVVEERGEALAAALAEGADAVLSTCGEPRVAGADRLVAGLLAEAARHALRQARPDALVLIGGQVAAATCRALGAEAIAVEGELAPGAPMGRLLGGEGARLRVVIRRGASGDDGALWRVFQALRNGGKWGNRVHTLA
jgi:uncharacterized protein YgbK (DUF1537 family)